jgi:hypothetical protein
MNLASGVELTLLKNSFAVHMSAVFGTDIARIINSVAPDSSADTPWIGFLGAVGGYHTKIGGSATFQDFAMVNEKHCVGAFDVAKSLCKTKNFLTIGLLPEGAFAAFAAFQKIGEAAGV